MILLNLRNKILDIKFNKLIKKSQQQINQHDANTICFLGDKPKKTPWNKKEFPNNYYRTKDLIENYIKNGYRTFMSDLAISFNLLCAEIVIDLKVLYPNINLICALPNKSKINKLANLDKLRYYKILKNCNQIRFLYDEYIVAKKVSKNIAFMINKSAIMITCFTNKALNKNNAVKYAKKQNLEIINLQ